MRSDARRYRPRARDSGLLVRKLEDEVLVYDLTRHRAHCLNAVAGRVFGLCDGETSVAGIAAAADLPEAAVWLGLRRLGAASLLEERAPVSAVARRDALRRLARAGLMLPVVASIQAPTAAQAATCTANAPGCRSNGVACRGSAECCSCCCAGSGQSFVCAAGGNCI